MELMTYVRILRRRWWIVLLAIALTALSAYGFGRLQAPRYESTAEIVIEPARPDWGLAQAARMVLRTYMTVADSDQWAGRVIDELQLNRRPEQLRGQARFSAEDDRMVIRIEIEDYDGNQANDIARTWARLFVEWRDSQNQLQRKEDRVYAYLRDQPRYVQAWPKTRVITAAGGIFGLAIAGVVIFFLEWLDSSVIRTRQDIEQTLDLVVVGAIPRVE